MDRVEGPAKFEFSEMGESSREMRFNLSPPLGAAKDHGEADQPVITDETNSSSDFNQWLHAMKMVARLPGGMPPEFRRKLWLALAEKYLKSKNIDWEKEEIKCFSEQWREDDVELGIQIVKDLHRTGSSLCSGPAGTINQAKLKRILLGYARFNPEVGYCQGFNMLGALILQVMDKEEIESIKVMIYLVEGILPRGYFSGSLGGLQADMAVFRELMTWKLPRLAKHLQKLQGPVENAYEPPLTNVFTMQWFLTMFCTCLPMTCVLRVWDLVLIEGSDVLLRTALVLWNLLEERILNAKTADEFYCKMGSFSSELLNGHLIDSNGLIERVVELGPIPDLQKLRDKHLYNISPFRNKKGLQLYYSDEEGDSDEDSRMAVATAWGFRLNRRGSAGLSNKSDNKDRIALDISLLKKQYDRLRERQRQAHIILTSAVARQGSNSNQSSIQMNQLLIGRNAIVTNNGRRLGPPQGAIPPARKQLSAAKSPKSTHSNTLRHGETLHWRDTDISRRRRVSLKWKDIKPESVQSASNDEGTSQLTGSAHSSRSSSSESKSKAHQRSDSSSYSEDSDGNSSTSTSLCDEDEHESADLNASSLEDSPIRKSKTRKKHSEVPHKKCLEDVLNSNEKQRTIDSQIPFIQLTTMESPVLNANKTDIGAIEFVKEDSETESNRLSYAGFVDQFSWSDLSEAGGNEPLKTITVDIVSKDDDMLSLSKNITSTSQLSPIPDITTYINNSSISPLRTPISAFNFSNIVSSEDSSKQFNVNDEGVTNEYFERVNIVERPTKLDLLYSLNEEDSIRSAFLNKTPSYQSSPEHESRKETSSLESSMLLSSNNISNPLTSTSQELDRKMKVLLEYSNQSSLSFIAEAKHEISSGKFREKQFDLHSHNYQPPGIVSTCNTDLKTFVKPKATINSEFHTITEPSTTSLTKCDNIETSLSSVEKKMHVQSRGHGSTTLHNLAGSTTPNERRATETENNIPLTEDLEKRFEALEMSFQSKKKIKPQVKVATIIEAEKSTRSHTAKLEKDLKRSTPTKMLMAPLAGNETQEKVVIESEKVESLEHGPLTNDLSSEHIQKASKEGLSISEQKTTKYSFNLPKSLLNETSKEHSFTIDTILDQKRNRIRETNFQQNTHLINVSENIENEYRKEANETLNITVPTSPLIYSNDHFGGTECFEQSLKVQDTVCKDLEGDKLVSSQMLVQSPLRYSEDHFGEQNVPKSAQENQTWRQHIQVQPLNKDNKNDSLVNEVLEKKDKLNNSAISFTTGLDSLEISDSSQFITKPESQFKSLERQISEKLLKIDIIDQTHSRDEDSAKDPKLSSSHHIKQNGESSKAHKLKPIKHIPSTADLEYRFRELERKLSTPNMTSSTQQGENKSVTSPLTTSPRIIPPIVQTGSEYCADGKSSDELTTRKRIPSTEDLETRFNALEIEKALKSPTAGTSNLLSPLQTKVELSVSPQELCAATTVKKPDIPSTEDLEHRFQALEQNKLAQKFLADNKNDKDGKIKQLKHVEIKETEYKANNSKTSKVLPSTQDLEARFEQLAKGNFAAKNTSEQTTEYESRMEKCSPIDILPQDSQIDCQSIISGKNELYKDSTDTDLRSVSELENESFQTQLSDAGEENNKRKPYPDTSSCEEIPQDLEYMTKSQGDLKIIPALDTKLSASNFDLKKMSDQLNFKDAITEEKSKSDLGMQELSEIPISSQTNIIDFDKTEQQKNQTNEPIPIVEHSKRKDLYKLESQSDETLTIGDQNSNEFETRPESRPTSCPEYRDPFDMNVVTTDRVLKIIEENSKILHRILKKTLADSGTVEKNTQSNKNSSQIDDSLSTLDNNIVPNTDSISPNHIISHSWLRSSFTLRSDDNISDRLASIKNTIKSIDTLCEEKSFRKEKCQRYIDSLFSSSSKTIGSPVNPLIRIDDFESQSSQERLSKRELKKDHSPRRRRNEDREEYESRVRRDMMPNSLDMSSDDKFSSLANLNPVDREVGSIKDGNKVDTQGKRPVSSYQGSGCDFKKKSITPVMYIPTKLEIRHTTVTSTFYDRYLTEKEIEKTFPKSKSKSPMSPTLTKSYLEISSFSATNFSTHSSKSAENSPSRRRNTCAVSPNDPVVNNKNNLLSTLENASSSLHIRSCDNILLQIQSTANNQNFNPLPVKLRKPPEIGINLGLYKGYNSDESSKS